MVWGYSSPERKKYNHVFIRNNDSWPKLLYEPYPKNNIAIIIANMCQEKC